MTDFFPADAARELVLDPFVVKPADAHEIAEIFNRVSKREGWSTAQSRAVWQAVEEMLPDWLKLIA